MWKIEKYKSTDSVFLVCSHCDSPIDLTYHNLTADEFDFCPYCGHPMTDEAFNIISKRLKETIYDTIDNNDDPTIDWVSTLIKLPTEEQYTMTYVNLDNETCRCLRRLLIAFKTDTIEYAIGYYDGYKWMTDAPSNKIIKDDIVAWRFFERYEEKQIN